MKASYYRVQIRPNEKTYMYYDYLDQRIDLGSVVRVVGANHNVINGIVVSRHTNQMVGDSLNKLGIALETDPERIRAIRDKFDPVKIDTENTESRSVDAKLDWLKQDNDNQWKTIEKFVDMTIKNSKEIELLKQKDEDQWNTIYKLVDSKGERGEEIESIKQEINKLWGTVEKIADKVRDNQGRLF